MEEVYNERDRGTIFGRLGICSLIVFARPCGLRFTPTERITCFFFTDEGRARSCQAS